MNTTLGKAHRMLPLVAACFLLAAPAAGRQPPPDEDRPPRDARPPGEHLGPRGPEGRGPRRGPHPPGGGPHVWLGRHLFRMIEADTGPLAAGEEDELMEFAREQMPRFYEALERLRQRDPKLFHEKLEEHAPRLRQLRRIHQVSPRIAGIMREHANVMFRIEREARGLRRWPLAPPERDQALGEIQAMVKKSVELEIEALDVLADGLAKQRGRRIADRVARLLRPNANTSDEPERLIALVDAWQLAGDDEQRKKAAAAVEKLVARQVSAEIDSLVSRRDQMRAGMEDEVEGRLARIIDRIERRNEGPRREPRGRGRGRRPAPGGL